MLLTLVALDVECPEALRKEKLERERSLEKEGLDN